MILSNFLVRLAAIGLLCTFLYEGGQYVKATLDGVATSVQIANGNSSDWG